MSIIEKALEKLGNVRAGETDHSSQDASGPEFAESPRSGAAQATGHVPQHERADSNAQPRRSRTIEIDLQKLKKYGYLTPGTGNIVIAEQYRRIKRPILINAFEEKGAHLVNRNLVMVTSAVPKEGKSFTSLNLALSIATEMNQTALFVDADIARRTNSKFLGVAGEPGLTDLLMSDKADMSRYLLKTNISNLSILPSGSYHEKTHEMWASNKMRNLMAEISSRYNDRVIVFDAPPVLLDSSTQILARHVGQIVFVIEAEKTHTQTIQEALETISDAQYIGLVLNKSNRRLVSEYGYYGLVNFPLRKNNPAGKDPG